MRLIRRADGSLCSSPALKRNMHSAEACALQLCIARSVLGELGARGSGSGAGGGSVRGEWVLAGSACLPCFLALSIPHPPQQHQEHQLCTLLHRQRATTKSRLAASPLQRTATRI